MLQVGMEKYNNMAKNRHKVSCKGCPVLNPRGSVHSKRSVQNFDACLKIHNHAQVIFHDIIERGHTAVFNTWSQKSMTGWCGWEIIKRHGTWIDAHGVNMGGTSKSGLRLQLVDARGVVKNCLDGKRYLVIISKAFFNPNLYETLLVEDQIECYGVKVYSRPRVFGGK